MRRIRAVLIVIAAGLVSCHKQDVDTSVAHAPGRYAGVGIVDADRVWAEIRRGGPAPAPDAASLADDAHLIVVVDSHTGEVRQCGDRSGYCVSMNPWHGGVASTPLHLGRHAAEIEAAERERAAAPNAKSGDTDAK